MRLLDRYVLRNFIEPFLLCFFGFIGIWFVFDLKDNMGEFIEYHVKLKTIAALYLSQLPTILVYSTPVGLLLALLFSLSKMSRHNEVISMLTAGRSLFRVLVPLMIIGVAASAFCYVLNSEWEPHAEAAKKHWDQVMHGEKRPEDKEIDGYLFRDRLHNRTWYVRKFKPLSKDLYWVHITQQNADGVVTQKWYAQMASYVPETHSWVLNSGMSVQLDENGAVTKFDNFTAKGEFRTIKDWPETPWRISSGQLEAQNLSIDELSDYLKFNSDFPATQLAPFKTNIADRFAFPLSCLVVIFLASPLGIVFSRRGVLTSIAAAIFLFFAMFLLRYFFLALGKGAHMNAYVAAWLPDVVFFLIGLFILYLRSSNRELKLAFWR